MNKILAICICMFVTLCVGCSSIQNDLDEIIVNRHWAIDDLQVTHNVFEDEELRVESSERNIVKKMSGEEQIEYHVEFSFIWGWPGNIFHVFSETQYKDIVGNANIIETKQYKLNIEIPKLKNSLIKNSYNWNRFSALGDSDFSQEEIDKYIQEILDKLNNHE